jgi:hypothetical protein
VKRRTAYAKAVAEAERQTHYFVATQIKAVVPTYRVKLAQDISELQFAWRDMSAEEKQAIIHQTIRKGRSFMRSAIVRPEKPPGPTVHIDPRERGRQLEAAYRAMSPEQRAEYDRGAV